MKNFYQFASCRCLRESFANHRPIAAIAFAAFVSACTAQPPAPIVFGTQGGQAAQSSIAVQQPVIWREPVRTEVQSATDLQQPVQANPRISSIQVGRLPSRSVGEVARIAPKRPSIYREPRVPAVTHEPDQPVPQATPAAYTPPADVAVAAFYTVDSGDTLSSIARSHGATIGALARENDMKPPFTIIPGQKLALPPEAGKVSFAAPAEKPRLDTAPALETIVSVPQTSGTVATAPRMPADEPEVAVVIPVKIPREKPLVETETASIGPRTMVDTEPQQVVITEPVVRAPEQVEEQEVAALPRITNQLAPPPSDAPLSFSWPVTGPVVQRFGELPTGGRNDGINIAVREGARVRAAEGGMVAYAGNELGGFGNLLLVRHRNGWVTAYAHNSEMLVQKGDVVTKGQVIALAGQSGSVDEPQLHFEVRDGVTPMDPMSVLKGSQSASSKSASGSMG